MSNPNPDHDQPPTSDKSFGPFLALDDGTFRFDTCLRSVPIWLGHNPSAMCGVLQYAETWTAEWSPEMQRIKGAYVHLLERTKGGLCGRLKLKPLNQTESGLSLTPAELIYQYIALSVLDQFSATHQKMADAIEEHCRQIFDRHNDLFTTTYVDSANFEFGFEFSDTVAYESFVAALPIAGIENTQIKKEQALPERFSDQPQGPNRCVFALNFAYRDQLSGFWQQLDRILSHLRDAGFDYEPPPIAPSAIQANLLDFQRALQLAKSSRIVPARFRSTTFLNREFVDRGLELATVVVDGNSYSEFRQRILDMQIEVYEPARRSPPEEFDMLFESENPLAILALENNKIAAMVFAGRLGLFLQERGVSTDPFLEDPTVYYSMDLTVAEEYRGYGIGTLMKQAMVMLAIENGVTALHGRNRDRLAAGMWAINLSLGAYELQHLPDDYPDNELHRDCIYYRCPLTWSPEMARYAVEQLELSMLLHGIGLTSANSQ